VTDGAGRLVLRPFEETERQAAQLAQLRRALAASRGTSAFSLAVCNSPALWDYLIERLALDDPTLRRIDLPAGTIDVFGWVRDAAAGSSSGALMVSGLEASVPSTKTAFPALRSLNASRELWSQVFAAPIVFWIPEYVAPLFARHAPDFWGWVSHHFEFVSELAGAVPAMAERFAGGVSLGTGLDVERKHIRLAELEQRLREAGDPPPPELVPHVHAWLNELGALHFVLGELSEAESAWQRLAGEAQRQADDGQAAVALGNLGLIYRVRGDLDQAEAMHRKALEINERLGRLEGMANQYGNLGLVYQTRGDLDQAEAMHRKALEINERLDRLEGMATQYHNLGLVYQARGDLRQAEGMLRRALELFERIGMRTQAEQARARLDSLAGRVQP